MANRRKTKDFNPYKCGVTHFLNKIGGKWKVLLVYGISKKVNRFSVLQKAIPDISKQSLVNLLRELEEAKIIHRFVFAELGQRIRRRCIRRKTRGLSSVNDWTSQSPVIS